MHLRKVSSNNTNKLSPQEQQEPFLLAHTVQIIQINLVLKNFWIEWINAQFVQIIQINLVLKN